MNHVDSNFPLQSGELCWVSVETLCMASAIFWVSGFELPSALKSLSTSQPAQHLPIGAGRLRELERSLIVAGPDAYLGPSLTPGPSLLYSTAFHGTCLSRSSSSQYATHTSSLLTCSSCQEADERGSRRFKHDDLDLNASTKSQWCRELVD